jgi:hypothetical protein
MLPASLLRQASHSAEQHLNESRRDQRKVRRHNAHPLSVCFHPWNRAVTHTLRHRARAPRRAPVVAYAHSGNALRRLAMRQVKRDPKRPPLGTTICRRPPMVPMTTSRKTHLA